MSKYIIEYTLLGKRVEYPNLLSVLIDLGFVAALLVGIIYLMGVLS
jgi:hypothetical protein